MAQQKSESSKFVLTLPAAMPVHDVITELERQGLPLLSTSAIYQVRKRARERGVAVPHSNGAAAAPSNGKNHSPDHWERQFMEAVIHLGIDRAAEILENTKRSYLGAL